MPPCGPPIMANKGGDETQVTDEKDVVERGIDSRSRVRCEVERTKTAASHTTRLARLLLLKWQIFWASAPILHPTSETGILTLTTHL